MKKKIFLCLCFICFFARIAVHAKGKISIVSWNVQTFFDSNTSGEEYAEFKKRGNWSKALYIERLERLCESINVLDADSVETSMESSNNRSLKITFNKAITKKTICFIKRRNLVIFVCIPHFLQ